MTMAQAGEQADPVAITPVALADTLAARAAEGRIVVAIAGPPGAGKSTFAELLAAHLNARAPGLCDVLPMDGYHFDDRVLEARGHRARKGAPHTFDVAGLAVMLDRLRANAEDEIAVPVFDRDIEIARAAARLIPKTARIILVEGNWLLLAEPPWDMLAPRFDVTVMLAAPEDELRRRLTARWVGYGLSGEALADKLDGNDLANARTVIERCRPADYVIDATLDFAAALTPDPAARL